MAAKDFLRLVNGVYRQVFGVQVSTGAANAGDIPVLNDQGVFDVSLMPTGIGADTRTAVCSEALAAGDLINVWNNSGTANFRKADATIAGKEAHGFVKTAFASGATATGYFGGTNDAVTGLTGGVQYLSTTAGKCSTTVPSASGNAVQIVGYSTAAASLTYKYAPPTILA